VERNVMAAQPSGRRVLVVDDDGGLRTLFRAILEADGYDVSTAENGEDALNVLRRQPRPDLILLDLSMPVLDGRGFRQRQQGDQALADIPVVICSGDADAAEAAQRLGARACLPKPVGVDRLLETIGRCR
jgi:CheY-like chemotaxis protein